MAENDGPFTQPLGAGRAHVVLAERLEHPRTGDARDRGDQAGGKSDRGQDDMLPGADAGRGQKPELDRKDENEDDRQKKLGRDDAEDRAHRGRRVDHGAPAQRGDDAERQAEGDAEHQGGPPKPQTVGQTFEDHRRGGHAVAERVAEVQLQRALPEDNVLDDGVFVQPHLAADLLVLLLDLLGGAVRIEIDPETGGIAGYPDQEEDQRYDQEYDKDRLQQAADDEGAHKRGEE